MQPLARARGLWVVIPASCESRTIDEVVRRVHPVAHTVVVVDDGSPDETGRRAHLAGAVVLTHPFNLGQGAALQTGIEFAAANGARTIATFDADGQHDPAD